MKDPDKVAQGKRNNRVGAAFETKTRRYLEEQGWTVSKWQNNVDLQTEEIIRAGQYFIPGRGLTLGKGFPDFIIFRLINKNYEVQFVECKTNNLLTKEEKQKLQAMKNMGHKCYIAFSAGREVKIREFMGYDKA